MTEISTKPYLLRAIHEWCTDSGFTPYIAVNVDAHTRVPKQFVRNGQIVLNIAYEATSGLKMDNDSIVFKARFGGISQGVLVPIENVAAIYASENGQGMSFEPTQSTSQNETPPPNDDPEPPKKSGPPTLTRVK